MTDNPETFVVQPCRTAARERVARRRDSGWWLLCGSRARFHGWARLQASVTFDENMASRPTPLYVSTKRMMDVAGSLLLLMSLMPLLLAVAVAVAWNSPGPVIFRQIRVGKDGTRFVMWKFRSMRTDAPMYARSPISVCDERLTRVGRWIRRLSLDELPQLFNVLRGEMSLVGPRPEMAFIADRYSATERLRLAATPGITGLWQISQDRGSAIHENLQYDLHYIREQNLRLDAAILLRTLSVVVRGADAV